MRNSTLVLVLTGLLATAPAFCGSLLLISIDGLPPGYVTDADRLGLKIPNLRRFLNDGAHATGVVGVVPTVTYPSHTTIVSGVLPAEHGIVSNTPFDPLNTNRDGWFWYAQDIKVPTLWTAASRAKLRTASVNWPVTVGEAHIATLLPEYWRVSNADDLKLLRALSRPAGRLEQLEAKLGPFVDGYEDTLESDRVRARFAVEILRADKPQFMAVHLVALDGAQHRDGPFAPAVFDVLEALDAMVGELSAAARANDPATTVALISDHGFIKTHTAVNLRARFVDAGLITLERGTPSDAAGNVSSWDAQVWPGGATAAVMLREPQNADLRKRVADLLASIASDSRNGIARVWSSRELDGTSGFPGAAFLVEFAPGFYFGTAARGELLTPATSKGTHGYLPQRPEMHASFFIQGPGITAGRNLGQVDMRQIAPTLAHVLAIELPTARQPMLPVFEAEQRK